MASVINHPAFNARPNVGQFAKDGEWEAAWGFAVASAPSFEDVCNYLDGATEVAFEHSLMQHFRIRLCGTTQDTARRAFECVAA